MQSMKLNIFEAIKATRQFKSVSYNFPKDASAMPSVTISESRKAAEVIDKKVILWDREYYVDIWTQSEEEGDELTDTVMKALREPGLMITMIADVADKEVTEKDAYRKRLSFKNKIPKKDSAKVSKSCF